MKPDRGQTAVAFVGTYSAANEESIHVLEFDEVSGRIERIGGVSGVDNPSFLAFDSERNRLFAVSETGNGAVVSFNYDPANKALSEINRQPTRGDSPCYISIDTSGLWLLAVNYMSGTVCLFPVDSNGRIEEMSDQIQLVGHSVRSDRQEAPHPHAIVNIPQTSLWLVPDLGSDAVHVYRLDPGDGKLRLQYSAPTPPASGPRHVSFHPTLPLVYVIQELDSTIMTYEYHREEATLQLKDVVSTLPDDADVMNTCADIHISSHGDYLYGSNRGHDSIATYRVLPSGKLELVGWVSTQGNNPRNFALVPTGSCLLVANQDSDSVVLMRLREDGTPHPTGEVIDVRKPVCLIVS